MISSLKGKLSAIVEELDGVSSDQNDHINAALRLAREALEGIEAPQDDDAEIRRRAAIRYCSNDDDIDIDGDALISRTDDGAWVAAWVWLPNQGD